MNKLTKEQEEKLIEFAKSSEDGFAKLYDYYFNMIFNYILNRTGNLELSKDLSSETFMKVIKYLPKYKITQIRFSSWLYRIATNEINQHFRKKTHISFDFFQPKDEPISLEFDTPDYELKKFENEQKKNEKLILARKCIKNLKPIDQTIITLRYFDKKKIKEVSEILNMKDGTIKVRINRIMKKLKQCIEYLNTAYK